MFIRAFPENRGRNPLRQANNNLTSRKAPQAYQIKLSRYFRQSRHGHSGNPELQEAITQAATMWVTSLIPATPTSWRTYETEENHDRCQDVRGRYLPAVRCTPGVSCRYSYQNGQTGQKGGKPDR